MIAKAQELLAVPSGDGLMGRVRREAELSFPIATLCAASALTLVVAIVLAVLGDRVGGPIGRLEQQ